MAILIRRMSTPLQPAFVPRIGVTWKRVFLVAGAAAGMACSDSPSGVEAGSLALTIVGLPAGSMNAVTVRGPLEGNVTAFTVNATDTLENLVPGAYSVVANNVLATAGTYAPQTATQAVEVRASNSPASVTVAFSITTGSISLNVTGLPSGTLAAVEVSGPENYRRQVTATETLTNLKPGSYQIANNTVTEASGHIYSASPLAQSVTVVASETPRNVASRYALSTGALEVVVNGLPGSLAANVTIYAQNGFSRSVTASTVVTGVVPGVLQVVAARVPGSASYSPIMASQNVEVPVSLTPARVEVDYVQENQPPPPGFNWTIQGMYITQGVQRFAGDVPLIAGKTGYLRVFVRASAPHLETPHVRVRLYNGTTLVQTLNLLATAAGAPTAVSEGSLASSWNAHITAARIQPGLRLVADVDPTNALAEADETDNTFPANGAMYEPRVDFTPPFNLTIVPVYQASTRLTGRVSAANVNEFTAFARKVLPIRDYQVNLHPTFSSSAPALESNDGNGGWLQLLNEINALRVAEGTDDYYLGIAATLYNSGVAGLAFTPGKTVVAWDSDPTAPQIAAHELGHAFGRRHAPCGGVGTLDPLYPYPSGTIGVYGYDINAAVVKPPGTTDLMGYCGFGWVSDYTYTGILDHRATLAAPTVAAAKQRASAQPSMIVWGRIENGTPVLEPAFTATTRPVLPSRGGPYRIEARSVDGRTLFAYDFEGEELSDHPSVATRAFAFAVPMSEADVQAIGRIALTTAGGRRSEVVASLATVVSMEATVESAGEVRFRLTDSSTRLAVVRDARTKKILAFVRGQGPAVGVQTTATEFEVQFADGVRSRTRVLRPVKR
jgi:hypothetical protein